MDDTKMDSTSLDGLSRDFINSPDMMNLARQTKLMDTWSEDQFIESIEETLANKDSDNIWVFGYGSLIWNPAFKFSQKRKGFLQGWKRRFCLLTYLSRGTPDFPGLTLGLTEGGSCVGTLYKIPKPLVKQELLSIWRREMIDGAYKPVWVNVQSESHEIKAITFIVNKDHKRYSGELDITQESNIISQAEGIAGKCSSYLFILNKSLAEINEEEAYLQSLEKIIKNKNEWE